MMVAAQVIWGSFSLLRVLWCLLPQTGYIHPDEFFQSPEVMAGGSSLLLKSWGERTGHLRLSHTK
uniref:Phosphatidylinositol glycan anchor biosynthesis, class Z n=1 Tax=Mus musculus TaxID=10090 RepID=A0A338P6P1_MOUSE